MAGAVVPGCGRDSCCRADMNLNLMSFRIAGRGSSKTFRPRGSSSVTKLKESVNFVTDEDS